VFYTGGVPEGRSLPDEWRQTKGWTSSYVMVLGNYTQQPEQEEKQGNYYLFD